MVEDHNDGTKALVVQDFTYGKYLGHLKVIFDNNGKVKSYSGNPILLNGTFQEDPVMKLLVTELAVPIQTARHVRKKIFLITDHSNSNPLPLEFLINFLFPKNANEFTIFSVFI